MIWMSAQSCPISAFGFPAIARVSTTRRARAVRISARRTERRGVSPSRSKPMLFCTAAIIAIGMGRKGTEMLREAAMKALEARGLDLEVIARLGVESSDKLPGEDCIAIPFVQGGKVVNHKYRTLANKGFAQDANAVKCLWNIDVLSDETLTDIPLIVTEGELDAMAAIQAGYQRTVSVPDGAPAKALGEDDTGAKYSYLEDATAKLASVKQIILATDADEPGANLLNDLAIRLGKHRCKWIRYPKGCKDLNDALREYGVRGVKAAIDTAKWMDVGGVYLMSELPPVPDMQPHRAGMDGLDNRYRVRMCDLAVVTGVPSHGKTNWVNDFVCRLASKHGWRVAFGSFEQEPQIDHKRNLRRWYCGAPIHKLTDDEIRSADEWIDQRFVFVVPEQDRDADLMWVLEKCAAAVTRFGARIVVLDPWNELDHNRPRDMSLTEYVGFAIRQLKKFARKYQIHLIVVAHPAKMHKNSDGQYPVPTLYDISDSAHWYNKPDIGVVIHRTNETETLVRVAKSRYHDIIGEPGDEIFTFDRNRGRYEQHSAAYQVAAE